jgi:hypothetical protein
MEKLASHGGSHCLVKAHSPRNSAGSRVQKESGQMQVSGKVGGHFPGMAEAKEAAGLREGLQV